MRWSREKRREVFSWCLFDFANSSFTTVIVSVVFCTYFTKKIARDDGETWSLAVAASNLLIVLTAPVIGAIADRSGAKKRFLLASYLTCVTGTLALWMATPERIEFAFAAFVIANLAFASGENLVAGFLPEIVEPCDVGRVSGWGWGLGYVGGLASLLLCLPLVSVEAGEAGVRATALVVAAFFLIGGIPTFLFVRERGAACAAFPGFCAAWRGAAAEVRGTFARRQQYPELFRFLFAHFVFSIGVYGVIQFSAILGEKVFELEKDDLILAYIAAQFPAALGALLVGPCLARWGGIRLVRRALLIWLACCSVVLIWPRPSGFWMLALLAGFAMGVTLAAARAVVSRFCPLGRGGEIFGFWGLFARLAALVAPICNYLMLRILGVGPAGGVLVFALAFAWGWFLLGGIDEQSGIARASEQPPCGDADGSDND